MGLFLYFFGGSLFGFSLFSSEELEESGAGFEGFFSDLDGLFGASFLGFSSASSDELEESLGAGFEGFFSNLEGFFEASVDEGFFKTAFIVDGLEPGKI